MNNVINITKAIHLGNLLFISAVLTLSFIANTSAIATFLPYSFLALLGYWGIGYMGVLFSSRKKKNRNRMGYGSIIMIIVIVPLTTFLAYYLPYEIRMIVIANILLLIGIKLFKYYFMRNIPEELGGFTPKPRSILIELEDNPKNRTEISNLVIKYCLKHKHRYFFVSDDPLEVEIDDIIHTVEPYTAYSFIGTPIYSLYLTPKS